MEVSASPAARRAEPVPAFTREGSIAVSLALPPLAEAGISVARRASGRKGSPVLGVGRSLEASPIRSSALRWTALPTGGAIAHLRLSSPGARGLRVGFDVAARAGRLEARFRETGTGARVVGPIALFAPSFERPGPAWGPVTFGDSVEIEIHALDGIARGEELFSISRISHLLTSDLANPAKALGDAAGCQRDVACFALSATARANATATALLLFTNAAGESRGCTGTLLNSSPFSGIPYILTSSVCIPSAQEASSVNTLWHYEATACGSGTAREFVQRSGGASLLARSEANGYSLLRLHDAVPSSVTFSGWSASQPAVGTAVAGLHHPRLDLKKMKSGSVETSDTHVAVRFPEGFVEPGSAGAGLFRDDEYFVGILSGFDASAASCGSAPGRTTYRPLAGFFEELRPYVQTSSAAPVDKSVEIVEFYNPDLDHYFITAEGPEALIVDSGSVGRWVRTGQAFPAWTAREDAPPGSTPVYRFYAFTQNSHFYTAFEGEKDYLVSLNPGGEREKGWIYEGIAFYTHPADEKATTYCRTGRASVQRAYNNGFNRNGSNHRYFMSPEIGHAMQQRGWTPEGTVICSHESSALRVRPSPVTCGVGLACSGRMAGAAGGRPPYVFSAAPTGVVGLSIFADASGVAVSGTPTSPGTHVVDVTVRDGTGAQASGKATIRIESAPRIWLQSSDFTYCYQGEACTVIGFASASGGRGAPYRFQAAGLPPGLGVREMGTFADLVGTPTAAGSFQGNVTAIDALGVERATNPILVSVYPALRIQGSGGSCRVNEPCSVTVATASGGYTGFPGEPPYSFQRDPASGGLPPFGMIVTTSADGTAGLATGTPTREGSYPFSICAYDRKNRFACTSVTIDVGGACTYTCSLWGSCVNGTQTCISVTSTPQGCSGTPPVLTQPCGTSGERCSYKNCSAGTPTAGIIPGTPCSCTVDPALLDMPCHPLYPRVQDGQSCANGQGCPIGSVCAQRRDGSRVCMTRSEFNATQCPP